RLWVAPTAKPHQPHKNAPRRILFRWWRLSRCTRLQSPSREISWHDASGSESRDSVMAHNRPARPNRSQRGGRENGSADALSWAPVPKTFRSGDGSLPQPWEDIFGPLRKGAIDDLVVVGQCGQSIDARVATLTGHSHYINSEAGLAHLHRLRALVDAVGIGVGTAGRHGPPNYGWRGARPR